jgi:ribosomal protein S21
MFVKMRDGESFEGMLKRFKLGVERAGVLREFRKHQAFLSKSEKARLKAKRSARKRQSKALKRAA